MTARSRLLLKHFNDVLDTVSSSGDESDFELITVVFSRARAYSLWTRMCRCDFKFRDLKACSCALLRVRSCQSVIL